MFEGHIRILAERVHLHGAIGCPDDAVSAYQAARTACFGIGLKRHEVAAWTVCAEHRWKHLRADGRVFQQLRDIVGLRLKLGAHIVDKTEIATTGNLMCLVS